MKSILRTGPNLILKVVHDSGEKIIGYASNLTFTVTNGQKTIFTVDSPFPAEISHAAAPSMVRGSLTVFMPKGMTLEKAGLVPYRTSGAASESDISPHPGSADNFIHSAHAKYIHLRIYDRETSEMFIGIDYVKVSQYTIVIQSKSVVRAELQFEGKYAIPGSG